MRNLLIAFAIWMAGASWATSSDPKWQDTDISRAADKPVAVPVVDSGTVDTPKNSFLTHSIDGGVYLNESKNTNASTDRPQMYPDGGPWFNGASSSDTSVSSDAPETQPPIVWVEVLVDRPRAGEKGQLLGFLNSFIGKNADQNEARKAERLLFTIGRYQAAVCTVSKESHFAGRLRCGLTRARTIRDIDISGLPLQLLEKNLRKRIFMRTGEILIPSTNKGKQRI